MDKKIVNVKVVIETVEDNEYETTELSSPTIDMAIEKMGAFERSLENSLENFGDEKENPTECMCRKCGVGLRCEHKDGEPHEQYLCGNCA